MASCLDACMCQNGCLEWDIWNQLKEKRNLVSSVVAGLMFSIGWWIMIDAAVQYPDQSQLHHATHVCGVVSTIALFMINSIPNSAIRGDNYVEGCFGQTAARIWFFLGFVLGFAGLIASSWILFGVYVIPARVDQYPGVAIFLQNAFIFTGGNIFKFGRSESNWE